MNKKDIAQLAKEMSEALKLDQRKDSTGNTTIRNKKTKDDFIKYLNEHPEERFWQALRNWARESNPKIQFILTASALSIGEKMEFTNIRDTFYYESD